MTTQNVAVLLYPVFPDGRKPGIDSPPAAGIGCRKMEMLCPGTGSVISSARSQLCSVRLRRNLKLKGSSFGLRSFRCSNGRSRFRIVSSKRSDFQVPTYILVAGKAEDLCRLTVDCDYFRDFQCYAKPSRLLPATEVKVSKGIPPEEKPMPFDKGQSRALFKITIWTSRMYGSSLSNHSSGLLLCVIDENGESVLQRIPAVTMSSSSVGESHESSMVHFQQGSDDEFTFEGPKLGRIQAVWISLESGQWRLGGLGLSVVYPPPGEGHSGEEVQFTGFQYDFITEDILLGEGSDTSMMELRPCRVTELSGPDPFVLLSRNSKELTSSLTSQTSNEESMREYADLKVSLLLYDAALIVIGSSVLSVLWGENSALAFSTGGVGGFLYLLLLQRSVDELPSPASISKDSVDRVFGRFWGPISTVAVAVAFIFLARNYGSGENPVAFTAKELIIGMMGFLVCKVAVVLAAFKPMTISWNRSTD